MVLEAYCFPSYRTLFLTASNVSHIELKDKQQPDPKFAADENEASMQTKDRTSSGDSDYKKEQVKPKRLYIRQKAFDKYSFQHSVEEPGVHGTDLSHRFEMNRTDSEKLIEEGFQVPFHAPDTIAKVLTNAVSTDDPEVLMTIFFLVTLTLIHPRDKSLPEKVREIFLFQKII